MQQNIISINCFISAIILKTEIRKINSYSKFMMHPMKLLQYGNVSHGTCSSYELVS